MTDQGLIEVRGKTIDLLDRSGLKAVAEHGKGV
jgi:hypothetical protein